MRILERSVLVDLVRVFGLAITVLTMLLVVMGVAGEAAKNGLGAAQIVQILPYIVPSLLPYTIPATLLLTVCIVYGRMAGDHEITAIKAAGINIQCILVPSFVLGAALSLGTFVLTDQFIPWARANIESVITLAMEDIFLDVLRANSSYNDSTNGVSILVSGVRRRTLIRPIIRYRLEHGEVATITAREANLKFDLQEQQVLLTLHDSRIETPRGESMAFDRERLNFPLPTPTDTLKAPRNMTIEHIRRELAGLAKERDDLLQRQMIGAVLALSEGAFDRLVPHDPWVLEMKERSRCERHHKLCTEIHGRVALSCSCFFFVLIGSPFAIVQGKRQILTNFAVCFIPILLVYYPIVLLTMNLCRDGLINPAWGMWIGNASLLVTACFVLRKVFRN
jgi:lipopolysaccharide export system permease protein